MAKVLLNPMMSGMSGRMGNVIFRCMPGGQTIATMAPDRPDNPSPAQQAQRQRFKEAAAYAKSIPQEPEARQHYEAEAARLHKTAYGMAISGYFRVMDVLKS